MGHTSSSDVTWYDPEASRRLTIPIVTDLYIYRFDLFIPHYTVYPWPCFSRFCGVFSRDPQYPKLEIAKK